MTASPGKHGSLFPKCVGDDGGVGVGTGVEVKSVKPEEKP